MKRYRWCLIGLWAVAALSHGQPARQPARVNKSKFIGQGPRFFILAIGVDSFANDFWPDLHWTVKDAEAVASKVGQGTGLRRDITVLTNAEARPDAIRRVLKSIAQRARPDDVVMVYLSSHGTLVADEGGRLEPVVVLAKTSPATLRQTGLPQERLTEWLEPIQARRKLLVYATCHSGLGKSRLPDHIREALAGNKGKLADFDKVSGGTIVLAASARGETAREDRSLGGDIYTHFFLEALAIFDRDKDGQVTALEAHDYAKERTYRFTEGRQRPTVKAELVGAGDIPLAGQRQRKGLPILEGYDERYAGYEVRIDQGQKGRLPLAFPLKPGTSTVELYPEGASKSAKPMAAFEVDADRGETVRVDDLFVPPPYSIGVNAYVKTVTNKKFAKVYGQESYGGFGLYAAAAWHNVELALFYTLPTEGGTEVWSGLKSEMTQYDYGARAGYRHEWWYGLGLSGYAVVGQNHAKLTFTDTNTGTSLSETAQSVFTGVGMQLRYRFGRSWAVSQEVEYHWLDHDFGQFGSLNGDQLVGRVSMSYIFGSKARRIK